MCFPELPRHCWIPHFKPEELQIQRSQGFLNLSKAGFTVEEQLKAIRPSLLLATAGQLELGQAASTTGRRRRHGPQSLRAGHPLPSGRRF